MKMVGTRLQGGQGCASEQGAQRGGYCWAPPLLCINSFLILLTNQKNTFNLKNKYKKTAKRQHH
jgi:hypothetical protein